MATEGRYDGTKGADGIPGGQAVARELDRMVSEGGVKSLHSRIKFLTGSQAGYDALSRAGVSATAPTLMRWLGDQELHPGVGISVANARRVDQAYELRRRETMAGSLKRQLEQARIEIYPVDQRAVSENDRRDISIRRVRLRPHQWAALVDAWSDGSGINEDWESIASDALGSDWDSYGWVSSVGIGA